MNATSDFDRRASAWLAEGPTELADRVLDAALREIHVTHQRRGLAAVRRFARPGTFGLQAAALVAVLLIAGTVLLNVPGFGVGGPSATPVPTPQPTPSPTIEPSPTPGPTPRIPGTTVASDGLALDPGVRYVLQNFEPAFSFIGSGLRFGIDGRAFAWFEHVTSPTAVIGVVRPQTAFAEGGATEPVPADIVGWLQRRGDLTISSTTAVTLGEVDGVLLEGTVPAGAAHNAGGAINVLCPDPIGCDFQSGGSLGYAPRDHVLILVTTVAAGPVVAMTGAPEGEWPAIGADLAAFLRSFEFSG